MDVFHSVKDIDRIPLRTDDMESSLALTKELHLRASDAMTLAVSIRTHTPMIHTLYPSLLTPEVVNFMKEKHGITVQVPDIGEEMTFPEQNLETFYQNALKLLRQRNIDLCARVLSES